MESNWDVVVSLGVSMDSSDREVMDVTVSKGKVLAPGTRTRKSEMRSFISNPRNRCCHTGRLRLRLR